MIKKSYLALALMFFLPITAFGAEAERLVVLNIKGAKESQTLYYTDLLRGYASRHTKYLVMTRENIETLVEPGTLEKCVDQCEVVVGRLLGSHRVISGVVFGGSRLILKLHDTKSGALVRSVVVSGGIEGKLESSFLELMGLEESSFEDLEARYEKMRDDLARKEAEEEKRKRLDALKDHMGGLKSTRSWMIGSHVKGQRFKFVPDLKRPTLWLGDTRYEKEDDGFSHTIERRFEFDRTTTVHLDEVVATKEGIGYDSEGRALVPMVIEEVGDDVEVVYVVEDLIMRDAKRAAEFNSGLRKVYWLFPLVMTTGIAMHSISPNGDLYNGQSPNLFKGLVVANILMYGLGVWLNTDTNKYNYPLYKEHLYGQFTTRSVIYKGGGVERKIRLGVPDIWEPLPTAPRKGLNR